MATLRIIDCGSRNRIKQYGYKHQSFCSNRKKKPLITVRAFQCPSVIPEFASRFSCLVLFSIQNLPRLHRTTLYPSISTPWIVPSAASISVMNGALPRVTSFTRQPRTTSGKLIFQLPVFPENYLGLRLI